MANCQLMSQWDVSKLLAHYIERKKNIAVEFYGKLLGVWVNIKLL